MNGPRITPVVDPDGHTAELLRMVAGSDGPHGEHPDRAPLNVFATLVRHPQLDERMVPLAQYLSDGLLPPRDRELAVLRTAYRCGCPYQQAHHRRIGLAAGLSDAEVDAVTADLESHPWPPGDAAVLRLVDELHDTAAPSDATWRTLAGRYTPAQLLELVALIGEYHKVAFLLNAAGTPLEEWLDPGRGHVNRGQRRVRPRAVVEPDVGTTVEEPSRWRAGKGD